MKRLPDVMYQSWGGIFNKEPPMTTKRYRVLIKGTWVTCKTAKESGNGWLHFELFNGTKGYKRPPEWKQYGFPPVSVADNNVLEIYKQEAKTIQGNAPLVNEEHAFQVTKPVVFTKKDVLPEDEDILEGF
jgi:hypothetical protein